MGFAYAGVYGETGWLERPVTFYAEMHAEDLAVRRDYHVSLIVEAQPDDSHTRDGHLGFGIGRHFEDAAMSAAACCEVSVALAIERKALRPSEPREESRHFAVRTDSHHRVEA